MTTLREKLQKLCKQDFRGRVRIIFISPKTGILRTEWFYLSAVPLSYFIDFLDCEFISEDMYKTAFQPEDHELQLTVAI